jgi:hypothetical protein
VARDQRLVVIDSIAENVQKGLLPEVDPEELRYIMRAEEAYRVAIVPETLEEVEWIADAVAARRNISLVVDEIDYWYPSSKHPVGRGFLNIARYGRHYNQQLVAVAREHSALHPSYRSQGILWVFPVRERGDVAYVQAVTGGFQAHTLRVVQKDSAGHILRTEVARIDGTEVRVCEFDLVASRLYSSSRQVAGVGEGPPADPTPSVDPLPTPADPPDDNDNDSQEEIDAEE